MNRTWRVVWWAMVLGATLPLFASAANVKIEPQPLGSALQDLAKQSGVQIIFFSSNVEGRRAIALSGTYTVEEALALLLEGSGLAFRMLNERTIEVAAKPVTQAPAPTIPAVPAPLGEVEVIAQREKLETLREELARLDEKFYAAYNGFNTNPQYNIVCTTERRRGRRGAQRICEPAFVKDATRDAEAARVADPCAPSAKPVVLSKTADYQTNVIDVVEKHPQLVELLKERHELAQRYQALRNESRPGAPNAGMKTAISSSRASAAALIGSVGRCTLRRSLASLPTEEWAIAIGLEAVEIEGKRYFCLPQPGVAQPIRNSVTCSEPTDLRRARFAVSPERGRFVAAYPGTPVTTGPLLTTFDELALRGVPVYRDQQP